MADEPPDWHAMTDTELEAVIRDRAEEIRHLREAIHDFGPSSFRDRAIEARQRDIDAAERELLHRRLE